MHLRILFLYVLMATTCQGMEPNLLLEQGICTNSLKMVTNALRKHADPMGSRSTLPDLYQKNWLSSEFAEPNGILSQLQWHTIASLCVLLSEYHSVQAQKQTTLADCLLYAQSLNDINDLIEKTINKQQAGKNNKKKSCVIL